MKNCIIPLLRDSLIIDKTARLKFLDTREHIMFKSSHAFRARYANMEMLSPDPETELNGDSIQD